MKIGLLDMADKLVIVPYNIKKHSTQVKFLIEKYLVPMYLNRMGITEKERSKYLTIEDCLDPESATNPKFENVSYVAIESSGRVVACYMNYFLSEQNLQSDLIDHPKAGMFDHHNPAKLRQFSEHRYEVCHDMVNLYKQYNQEILFYMETGIVIPEYRRLGITKLLTNKACKRFGQDYGILWEGMKLVDNDKKCPGLQPSDEANLGLHLFGVDGFLPLKRVLSYDNYVVDVLFRPPGPI